MRSEPSRPARPQSGELPREPGAAWGREPGGPGAPASPWHRAGSGSSAARARPPQGAPPLRRRAVRPGRQEAGARVSARGARPNGGACVRGPRSHRLGRPGRAVPEPHVRGAGRRQWLPVGRLVPPEPDSPFWSFAGHFGKLGNQHFPKYSGSERTGSAAMAHGPSRSVACGIFPDRGTNPCPLHRQMDSQPLRHQGSPYVLLKEKYWHLELAHQEHPRPYFKSVLWWGGVILMAVGETGNFAAYGFAPITLIAPLGCMSVTGTYLLVNFAPNITQEISARTVQYYFVGWRFMTYGILEILIFCILLYFHKRKGIKHIVILLTLVALLASLTVISVKAVSGMITFSVTDKIQLTYPIFYIMFIIMIASCVFQVKLLNQATKLYHTATVVPINHTFFTISAIIAGIVFYQEFLGAAFLTIFIYLFGCFLSVLGVVLVTRNREKEHLPQSYIDFGHVPGKQTLDKIQPDSNSLSYGTVPDGSDSTKSPSGEKKEV
ncbi:NIPA-like protein 2 isoform X3 [Kogia breviceps]|uniref:NIPA-like protein 2 isoform X3 n=1 Tax=Kogia breviceps TaxID=27615 RepID=UPI0034D32A13